MDKHTLTGIALAIFGLGVIIANIIGVYIENKRDEDLKDIRKQRRGIHG